MSDDFHGMKTGRLENEHLRLDYLAEAGPRLVRLVPAATGRDLLADAHDFRLPTPYGEYHFLGGHRLWLAPESFQRTYTPEAPGLAVEPFPQGVRLCLAADSRSGVAKTLVVRLDPSRPAVHLEHELRNDGRLPLEVAPWAITQLRLGGTALLPLPGGPADPDGLLPNRRLVLWPYTSWRDPRLVLADEAVLVRGADRMPPVKVGHFDPQGWLAYYWEGILFVKRFQPQPGATHPDLGCNAEVFCGDRFLELETLGPLARLEPGGSARHSETWELYAGWDQPFLPEGLRRLLRRRLD